jgi:dolichol-phosphate mannosyltransferase
MNDHTAADQSAGEHDLRLQREAPNQQRHGGAFTFTTTDEAAALAKLGAFSLPRTGARSARLPNENTRAGSPFERRPTAPVELSIIAPTFNEAANLESFVAQVEEALGDGAWEIIFVDDDSPDGTSERARALHRADGRVRVLRRVGRRGLSSACIEGMLSSSAPYLLVMDADLQHDASLLPRMLQVIRENKADLVVASRYADGGGLGAWNQSRARLSRFATRLTQRLTGAPLTDPMSGFFALRREVFDEHVRGLSGLGFKILLDLVLTARGRLRIQEVPYVFGLRLNGESKLSTAVSWECLLLLIDKLVGRFIPVRFFAFGCVGLLGAGVHFTILSTLMATGKFSFVACQAAATGVAMVANYTVNNVLTYAGQSLSGWRWLKGLASFALISGIGALANIGVANFLFQRATAWPVSALAGIAASAVWNYAVSSRYTWKRSS